MEDALRYVSGISLNDYQLAHQGDRDYPLIYSRSQQVTSFQVERICSQVDELLIRLEGDAAPL